MKKKIFKYGYVPVDRSSDEGIDWSKAIINPDLPNLKFSTKSVTLRMPTSMLSRLKMEANKRDVPYQSFMKVLLQESLEGLRR